MPVFRAPRFRDEEAARLLVEGHLRPDGPVCPPRRAADRVVELRGQSTKPGVRKCGRCRKLSTARVGTAFESGHVPPHEWLVALCPLCSSRKGISSHQLRRTLGVTLKTAWFMSRRLREAMRDGSLAPLGGEGKAVEADGTHFGPKGGPAERARRAHGPRGKRAVVALVGRGGAARSLHVERAGKATAGRIARESVAREGALMTDGSRPYGEAGAALARHGKATHPAGEYARDGARTNTIEGALSTLERGMRGVRRHRGERRLRRHLAEFGLRCNSRVGRGVGDGERAALAPAGARGKRLRRRASPAAEGQGKVGRGATRRVPACVSPRTKGGAAPRRTGSPPSRGKRNASRGWPRPTLA